MRVRAYDGGSPSLTSDVEIDVRIEVFRNNHAPVFSLDIYRSSLSQGSDISDTTVVQSVFARDEDTDVSYLNTFDFTLIRNQKNLHAHWHVVIYYQLSKNARS